jgi:hypothetical protein
MNSIFSQSRQGGRRYRSFGGTPSLGAMAMPGVGSPPATITIPDGVSRVDFRRTSSPVDYRPTAVQIPQISHV